MKTEELLAYVFECAIADREGLADAYKGEGEFAAEAVADVKRFKELRGRLLPAIPTPKRGLAGIRYAMSEMIKQGTGQFVSLDQLRDQRKAL